MPSELVPLLAQLLTALVSGGATIIAAYITVSHLRGAKPERGKAEVAQRKHPWHPLLAVAMVIAGWAIGGAIAVPLARTFALLTWSSVAMGGAIGWAIGAGFAGFMTGQALRLAGRTVEWRHTIAVVIGWTAAGLIGGGLSWELALSPRTGEISAAGGAIGGTLAGAIGGFVSGRTLQNMGLPVATDRLVTIAVGWAVGGGVGGFLSWAYFGYVDITAVAVAGAVTGAIIGTIGGGLMFFELSHLRQNPRPLSS